MFQYEYTRHDWGFSHDSPLAKSNPWIALKCSVYQFCRTGLMRVDMGKQQKKVVVYSHLSLCLSWTFWQSAVTDWNSLNFDQLSNSNLQSASHTTTQNGWRFESHICILFYSYVPPRFTSFKAAKCKLYRAERHTAILKSNEKKLVRLVRFLINSFLCCLIALTVYLLYFQNQSQFTLQMFWMCL